MSYRRQKWIVGIQSGVDRSARVVVRIVRFQHLDREEGPMGKSLLVPLCAALLCAGVAACGSSHDPQSETNSQTSSAGVPRVQGDLDDDKDNATGSTYDFDDNGTLAYGYPADPEEQGEITALVKRYYTALASHDGAVVCSLIKPSLAKALAEQGGASHHSHRSYVSACGRVATKLLAQSKRPAAYVAPVEVLVVRVSQGSGLAVVRQPTAKIRELRVELEGNVWRLDSLYDNAVD
jgi:hypothetical protein